MFKIIVAIASGILFVSCKPQSVLTDAQAESVVGTSKLSVDCVSLNDGMHNLKSRTHVQLNINGKSVTIVRTVELTSAESGQSSSQSINGQINSVFDFNSISQSSAQLLLNPTSVKSVENGKTSARKLPYVMIEYSKGQLKVSEADAKLLFTQSKCKTKS